MSGNIEGLNSQVDKNSVEFDKVEYKKLKSEIRKIFDATKKNKHELKRCLKQLGKGEKEVFQEIRQKTLDSVDKTKTNLKKFKNLVYSKDPPDYQKRLESDQFEKDFEDILKSLQKVNDEAEKMKQKSSNDDKNVLDKACQQPETNIEEAGTSQKITVSSNSKSSKPTKPAQQSDEQTPLMGNNRNSDNACKCC